MYVSSEGVVDALLSCKVLEEGAPSLVQQPCTVRLCTVLLLVTPCMPLDSLGCGCRSGAPPYTLYLICVNVGALLTLLAGMPPTPNSGSSAVSYWTVSQQSCRTLC